MAKPYLMIFCTVPDPITAKKISRILVEEKLAACCNIVPGLNSIYRWENKIQDETELLLIIKTRQELFSELEQRVKNLHPYAVPEIIAMPILRGNIDYLKWMDENVKKN
jgi:periplasmic divalent cation tolerance protein